MSHLLTRPAYYLTLPALALLLGVGVQLAAARSARPVTPHNSALRPAPLSPALSKQLARMPLSFTEAGSQQQPGERYVLRGRDKSFFFNRKGVTVSLPTTALPTGTRPVAYSGSSAASRWNARLEFVGSNPQAKLQGEIPTGTKVSYFTGARATWRSGLQSFSRLRYRQLWRGVDLAYTTTAEAVKHEFVVAPGVDPAQIRLAYRGVDDLRLTEDGGLKITTPAGSFEDTRPIAFQEQGGKRVAVPVRFVLDPTDGEAHGYHFALGNYDRRLPLIIDPSTLVYSGLIGGSGRDVAWGVAVDRFGAAYITGYTWSFETTFPVTVGPDLTHATTVRESGDLTNYFDAFIAKVRPDGKGLAYCGFIGGGWKDIGYSVAADDLGCAYIGGITQSSEATFPVVQGPFLHFQGNSETGIISGFVAKVSADGTHLVYCGYIGGEDYTELKGVAVDSQRRLYAAGTTRSSEVTFPVKVGPDTTLDGVGSAFVSRVAADGGSLEYCGYIGGGKSPATATGIAVDSEGSAYVCGNVVSDVGFPVKVGPDLTPNGDNDAFVAKVSSTGESLEYCGYIGGSGREFCQGISVWNGRATIVGSTPSQDGTFPTVVGPDLTYNGGTAVGFIARVSPTGENLEYSGFIGGSPDAPEFSADGASGVATDTNGCAYVVGGTGNDQANFPVKLGPDLTYNGGGDAYIAKVAPAGEELVYCGYVGGRDYEAALGVAVDAQGAAYLVGSTYSPAGSFPGFLSGDYPTQVGPALKSSGEEDIFVTKVQPNPDVTLGPELIGEWGTFHPTATGAGSSRIINIESAFTVRNIGTTKSGPCALVAYFSSNAVPDQRDWYLGTLYIPALVPGAKSRVVFSRNLLPGVTYQGGYLIAYVDNTQSVGEQNEENNLVIRGPLP